MAGRATSRAPAMADPQQDFAYQDIVLYKTESLGSGSYGGVCRAKCNHLPCAAKIMHPTLFDKRDPGTASYLRKFQEECRLLSLARHPNIVQYLGTYQDPETHLPVLLMELCNESLTKFLERSPGPLPYHTELSISHDIALALVYLHSNGLIHRDLTGNNILMVAGTRAKVTDFGMSKLAKANPHMTSLTLCPGNVLYMSPEALDESPTYTDKLDIFSFGVLLVQIMTRQFPNPSDRFQVIDDPRYPDKIRMPVPETERRHNHLQLIRDTHPLKPVALQCLKNKERERPSAQEVSVRLSELKGAPQYTESIEQPQTSSGGRGEAVGRQEKQQQQKTEHQQPLQVQQQELHKDVEDFERDVEKKTQQQLQSPSIAQQPAINQVTKPPKPPRNKQGKKSSAESSANQNRMFRKSYDLLFKILLIGDSGVGKTCMLVRYAEDVFNTTFISTIGVDFKIKTIELEGKRIKLQMWDTAGQERFRTVTTAYYRGANGVVLIYDITNEKSFLNIQTWLTNIKQNAAESVQKILVGNKCDLQRERVVSEERGRAYTHLHGIPFCETSAKTGHNVSMVFEILAKAILDNLPPEDPKPPTVILGQQLPDSSSKAGVCCRS